MTNLQAVGAMLLLSTGLSALVKYVLPLGITTYTKPGLWLVILTPVTLLALVLARRMVKR